MITPSSNHLSGSDGAPSAVPCKNHPLVPSGYFAADQPWAKYCRQCALNVALSGRRIEKELSGVQFQQKMRIGSAASELRSSLGVIEQSSQHYRRLAERTEEAAAHLQGYLRQVESALRELTAVKEKLEGVYSRQFAERVQVYYERQSRAALLSLQIKREVQTIQSNFGTLIEAQKEVFAQQEQRWASLLQSFRQDSLSQEDYRQSQQKIVSSIEEFYTHLEKMACFRIDLKVEKPNSTQEQLDMTLTPIDGNSLAETISFQQLKLSMKPRGQLKLKTHKKLGESFSSSKACTKRSSLCDHNTIRRA